MNFRTNITRQALAVLGACFGLLLLASPATARPDGFQPQLKSEDSSDAFTATWRTTRRTRRRSTPATWGDQSDAFTRYIANERAYHASHTGIPDSVTAAIARNAAAPRSSFPTSATARASSSARTGSPVGADGDPVSQPRHRRRGHHLHRAAARAAGRLPAAASRRGLRQVAGDGFDWETTGVFSGGILAAMLLGLMATIALRNRGGLKSA